MRDGVFIIEEEEVVEEVGCEESEGEVVLVAAIAVDEDLETLSGSYARACGSTPPCLLRAWAAAASGSACACACTGTGGTVGDMTLLLLSALRLLLLLLPSLLFLPPLPLPLLLLLLLLLLATDSKCANA